MVKALARHCVEVGCVADPGGNDQRRLLSFILYDSAVRRGRYRHSCALLSRLLRLISTDHGSDFSSSQSEKACHSPCSVNWYQISLLRIMLYVVHQLATASRCMAKYAIESLPHPIDVECIAHPKWD